LTEFTDLILQMRNGVRRGEVTSPGHQAHAGEPVQMGKPALSMWDPTPASPPSSSLQLVDEEMECN
jgi:hypothetical protein